MRALWIGVLGLVVAGGLAWLLSRRIAKPLERLAADTQAVARFELGPTAETASRFTEVRRLSGAMEEMKSGLRSFGRYVPKDLVREVLASGQEVVLGGERRVLTVGFVDVADFTTIAETLTPEELVDWLGRYFEVVSEAVVETSGTVDKYIGDAVMAFWGAPQSIEAPARRACGGVLRAAHGLAQLRATFEAEGRPAIRARFGLATGEMLVGNIGSRRRLNYTAIGDPVNLASRLEGLNKMYGTNALVDEATAQAVSDDLLTRRIERVAVKGKREATLVFELVGRRADATPEDLVHAESTDRAHAAYESGSFADAAAHYEALLGARPDDGVAFVMVQRCRELLAAPPDDWDGVRRLDAK